jgi:putative membrane protein
VKGGGYNYPAALEFSGRGEQTTGEQGARIMRKRIGFIAACALAALPLALGVTMLPAHAGQQNMNGNMNGNMNSNTGGMNGNMKMDMSKSPDMKFMTAAAQGGMAEVAMARVALDRASSDAVKQYAQKMIDDHTANNNELMQLASGKGITLPAATDARHQMMMDKMSKLSGMEFDMEYVKNAGVKDHEAMEKLMMSESQKGKDADAKAFAARTLPAVRMHLTMARDMTTSMKNMHSNMPGGTHGNMNSNMSGNMNSNSNTNSNTNSNMKRDKKTKGNMNGNMNSNNSNR